MAVDKLFDDVGALLLQNASAYEIKKAFVLARASHYEEQEKWGAAANKECDRLFDLMAVLLREDESQTARLAVWKGVRAIHFEEQTRWANLPRPSTPPPPFY